ncbi:hypothetical protein [Acidocella aminolytica]|uniref:Uncharacterized protein n=1 Tax=Acidocella aminolytica 101 = DSM 11237 TaxID=1120923 RepID=A0A0D6PI50_9PROT|nr:hypothetical protein [Acidocella aminolytica]GAN81450.1 hypothetical protein Aam_096_009 [Acidocella aminolytica 101 = DSM 11237]GBQ41834.1 hypothetical protein AA11237_2798 [Acidocella aminolytica 101 = DSM 11237]SHF01765.1 hypothetical protein SAMN02746095_01860 [Acidocella aminolytica 101 = DSM 11237]
MNKLYSSLEAALDGVLFDGMTILSGGFGLSGNPESLRLFSIKMFVDPFNFKDEIHQGAFKA